MGSTFKMDASSAKKSLNVLSGKIDELSSAKSKIEKAKWLIKADDIFVSDFVDRSFYNNIDTTIEKIKKCNQKLDDLLSTAKYAVNAFEQIDNEKKSLNSKKKKTSWTDIFKGGLKGYGAVTTIALGTSLFGMSGFMMLTTAETIRGISGNSKSSGISVTKVGKSNGNNNAEQKGSKLEKQYESFKEERKEFVKKYPEFDFGNGKLNSYGEDGLIVKNGDNFHDYSWDQLQDKGNNDIIACPGYSEAAYHNMVEGTDRYNYMDYWSGSSWASKEGGPNVVKLASGHESVMNTAYERLNTGKPSLVSVNSPTRGNEWHYVVITGIKKSAIGKKNSGGSLEMSDFIIYDPAGGTTRTMENAGGGENYNTSCSNLWGD